MRKIIALGIMLLFLGMTISSSTGLYLEKQSIKPKSFGNILYVGGNGTGNYSSIQDAIDNASDGDTVFVYSGKYFSIPDNRIIITKSIDMFGEDKNTTIIEGYGETDVITVTSDYVTITGFTIKRNFSNSKKVCVGILLKSSHNTIYGNFFNNIFGRGLKSEAPYNHIHNNTFFSSNDGVELWRGSNHSVVTDNIFLENGDGIWMVSCWNLIRDNIFIGNARGLRGDSALYNMICDNSFIDNYESGIELYGGVIFGTDLENKILNNTFSNNSVGIRLSCRGSIVEGNIIENSSESGIKIWGINNKINRNIIRENRKGVYATGDSTLNKITCNNFFKNGGSFMHSFPDIFLFRNNWDGNYWDSLIGNIKMIFGNMEVVIFTWRDMYGDLREFAIYPPWLNFDWHPAQEPYDIGV